MIITYIKANHPKFADRLINKSLSLILREHLYASVSEDESIRFSYDSDMNIYFMGNSVLQHRINCEMPLTIVDSYRDKRPRMGFRKRLLVFGSVKPVEGRQLELGLAGYNKRHPVADSDESTLYVMQVDRIVLLDESTFGMNESFTFTIQPSLVGSAA